MKQIEIFYDADQEKINKFLAEIGPRYVDTRLSAAQYSDGSLCVMIVIIYLA